MDQINGTKPDQPSITQSSRSPACARESCATYAAPRSTTPIDADFFSRSADVLARDLIGRIIQTSFDGVVTSGIITETAAYLGAGDKQSHEYKMKHAPVEHQWSPGCLYVYSTQGHTMLTVAAAPFKGGATVLIRSLEPLHGVEEMGSRSAANPEKITVGPGNLSRALGVTVAHNTLNLLSPSAQISILPGFALAPEQIAEKKRGGDKGDFPPLRFFRAGSEWVS